MHALQGVGLENTVRGTVSGFSGGGFEGIELFEIFVDVDALYRFVHDDFEVYLSGREQCFGLEEKSAVVLGERPVDCFGFEPGLVGEDMMSVDLGIETSGDCRRVVYRTEVFVFHAAVAGEGALGGDPADGELDVALMAFGGSMRASVENVHGVDIGLRDRPEANQSN